MTLEFCRELDVRFLWIPCQMMSVRDTKTVHPRDNHGDVWRLERVRTDSQRLIRRPGGDERTERIPRDCSQPMCQAASQSSPYSTCFDNLVNSCELTNADHHHHRVSWSSRCRADFSTPASSSRIYHQPGSAAVAVQEPFFASAQTPTRTRRLFQTER